MSVSEQLTQLWLLQQASGLTDAQFRDAKRAVIGGSGRTSADGAGTGVSAESRTRKGGFRSKMMGKLEEKTGMDLDGDGKVGGKPAGGGGGGNAAQGGGYGQAGGYPQQGPPSGHSNATYAAGGAAGGGLLAAGAQLAYQQYGMHQNPDQKMGMQGVNWQHVAMAGAGGAVAGGAAGYGYGKFFANVKKHLDRDYVIIVDKSGSMTLPDQDKDMQRCTRWDNARRAVELLAPKITEHDSDGITLWLFSSGAQKFDGIKDPQQVRQVFQQNRPSGSTNLAGVLDSAFREFFGKGKPVSYLVITDGQPDSESDAKRNIEQASSNLRADEHMSITFIQVGDDQGAQRYLESLDNGLNCKFDIVDHVKDDDLRRMGFEKLIESSITD